MSNAPRPILRLRRTAAAWIALAVLAQALPGAAADAPVVIDPSVQRAITQEVLSSQRDPRGRAEKLAAIRAYERFVMEDLASRSTLRAEAMHNLADLYAEIETAAAARPRGKSAPAPVPSRKKSIAVYERLLALYPARADNDGALYQLARAYEESGRADDAAASLRRLLTDYPQSAYAPEAAFRLGLRAFANRDFQSAAGLFRTAARAPDVALVEAARFHLGWTALNLQEYRQAADAFVSILDAAAATRLKQRAVFSLFDLPEAEAAFLSEVVKALLLSFDYLGGPEEMRAYFAGSEQRPYEETLYRTLGMLYQEQDRTADAVAAYEAFLAAAPLHPEAPRFQLAIAEAYTRAKWQSALLEARERLIERYQPGSTWAKANPLVAAQVAYPAVKDTLYQLALYDHSQAQGKRRPDAWQKALARHDRFLALFPKEVEAGRVAWLRGEALFELGRYDEAAEAYRRSAYEYPLHPHTRDAAYAAVAAAERMIPPDGAVASPAAARFADETTRFLDAFPDDGRNPDLLMKAAETAARAGQAGQADVLARRLVAQYPKSRWTTPAQRLIAQALYDQGRFLEAEHAFRLALAGAPTQQASVLSTLAASALYQGAGQFRDEGKSSDAISAFIRVASDYPTTPLAPAALTEAADLHLAAGRATEARALWQRLVKEYPDSDTVPAALQRLASDAAAAGDLPAAIGWYERFAARSDAAASTETAWLIAALAERAQDWSRAERTLSALASRADLPAERAIEAGFRAARAAARQGRPDREIALTDSALIRYRAWRAEGRPTDVTAADVLAAQALVALGDRRAAACATIPLREPMERALTDKRAALDEALAAYAEAAEIRVAETTTAATFKIGAALDEFFKALLASERPPHLSEEEREQYDILLEEQAAPFEERAVQAYETNVRRAQELGLYNDWIAKSYERLAALRPVRYHRPERSELIEPRLEVSP